MTKTWFRHRFVAELCFTLGLALMGTLVGIELLVREHGSPWITKVASLIFFIVGLYLAYTRPRIVNGMSGVNRTPLFALGDTISWRVVGYDPWTISVVYRKLVAFGWRVRFAIDRADGKERAEAAGENGYILDVALDNLTTLHRASPDSDAWQPRHASVRALFLEGAITSREHISYCADAGQCLRLSSECARQAGPDAGSPAAPGGSF